MNILHDVSKKELLEVMNNGIDQRGKRIKIKESNYTNLLNHIARVPNSTFQVLPANDTEYVNGNSRTVTVKENVLNSIAQKAIVRPIVQEKVEEAVNNTNFNTITNDDNYFEQINKERQSLLNEKIEVDKIIEKVNNSTKLLNDLSIKETEEQKKYEEKQRNLNEVNQKIVNAIKMQMDTLIATREKYKAMLEENSRIEIENQEKITQIQSRITQYEQNNLSIEDDIARQQEVLNALMNFENNNIVDFTQFENNTEVVNRRIA